MDIAALRGLIDTAIDIGSFSSEKLEGLSSVIEHPNESEIAGDDETSPTATGLAVNDDDVFRVPNEPIIHGMADLEEEIDWGVVVIGESEFDDTVFELGIIVFAFGEIVDQISVSMKRF